MHLRELQFTGYFEEQNASSSEALQVVAPDNDMEADLVSWILLPMPQTVEGDPARRGYSFHYELGKPIEEGVYALNVSARDASGQSHAAEIAAAPTAVPPSGGQREHAFARFWLLSESLHFKPVERLSHEQYHGAAYGHLRFGESAVLPHRRLFGAVI